MKQVSKRTRRSANVVTPVKLPTWVIGRPPARGDGPTADRAVRRGRRRRGPRGPAPAARGTRWPSPAPEPGWEHGNRPRLPRASWWLTGSTASTGGCRKRRLNQLDHFLTEIDGQRIHFVHAGSRHPDALPLVLSHGWPGSVVEFLDVFGPLTDPAHGGSRRRLPRRRPVAARLRVLRARCPSRGGTRAAWPRPSRRSWTGSVPALRRPGWRLGVARDHELADMAPDRVCGPAPQLRHRPPAERRRDRELDPEEQAGVARLAAFQATGAGYSAIQGTKPQTLGYALDDSPAGLAAWIVEKFRAWSDCDGDVERSFTKDQLLTNVMLYWLTRHGDVVGTALLRDATGRPGGPAPGTVDVPTGVANYPGEITRCLGVGRESLPGHALGRPATGRPLRGDGGPRPVRRRPPRVLPYRSLKTGECGLPARRVEPPGVGLWTLAEGIVAASRPDPPLDIVLVVAAAAGCALFLRPRQRRI